MTSQRAFRLSLALSILARAFIAWKLPMTGDEAYYVFWGRHPALGYYDQPPMVGWWLTLLLQISDSPLWIRLPAVLAPAFVAWVVTRLSARPNYWAGAIFALAPITILLPLITTDVPLLFWVALTALLWRRRLWAWAGIAAGAAFLSKYFAVLLLPALGGHLIYTRGWRKAWKPLLLALVTALWGPALHLYWNANHCWANFVFNLFVRNGEERFLWWHVQSYLYQQLYLLTPVLLFFVGRAWWKRRRSGEFAQLEAAWLWAIPTLVFFLLTFRFGVGMHFVLPFYPYFFSVLPLVFSEAGLRRTWVAALLFLALHGVAAGGILHFGKVEWLRGRPFYRGLLQTLNFPQIAAEMAQAQAELSPHGGEMQWFADAYTQAALLGFYAHRSVWVLGGGSDFGRQTDFVADWRGLDGQSGILFYQHEQEPLFLKQYFREVKTRQVQRGELSYWIVQLQGFDAATYERSVLASAFEKFYLLSKMRNFPGRCPLLGYQSTRR